MYVMYMYVFFNDPATTEIYTYLHTLSLHDALSIYLAARRADQNDPQGFESNANVKLINALSHLMLEVVPSDPSRDEYRQGNTLGAAYRHWRRAQIGRRFRQIGRASRRARVCQ